MTSTFSQSNYPFHVSIRHDLPPFTASRGPITYPSFERVPWLDSDPYGLAQAEASKVAADAVVASGGFCAPHDTYDIFKPLSALKMLHMRQRELNERTRWRNRLRRWWRAHYWPAVIADLRARLDAEHFNDWE